MFRAIVLTHRYVGIAVGLLMAVWCLSGVVMMYVPYPRLTEEQRVGGLQPIEWNGCCVFGGARAEPAEAAAAGQPRIADDARVSAFQLEMLGDRPVLRATLAEGARRVVDLRTGTTIETVSNGDAALAASRFAQSTGVNGAPRATGVILRDQWTVGYNRGERPIHELAFDDAAGTVVYVSSTSGKVLQTTQKMQRFWNWLGSVPHWLYPTVLRQNVPLWTQVVVWSSVIGVFLTVTGIYLGIKELRRRNGKLSSPHRGIMYWHHVPGLIFGSLVLTWTLSGLFSMNPWGMMEIQGVGEDMQRLTGEPPRWSEVRESISRLAIVSPSEVVSLSSAPFNGKLYVVASARDGRRRRLDASGLEAPLTKADIDAAVARLFPAAASAAAASASGERPEWSMLTTQDAYHYSTTHQAAMLPVVRIIATGEGGVRHYLDPVSGRLVNKVDPGGRAFRWWHSGLHTFDFSSVTRGDWFRNGLMLPLLLGAAFVCVTGTWIGIKRLTRA